MPNCNPCCCPYCSGTAPAEIEADFTDLADSALVFDDCGGCATLTAGPIVLAHVPSASPLYASVPPEKVFDFNGTICSYWIYSIQCNTSVPDRVWTWQVIAALYPDPGGGYFLDVVIGLISDDSSGKLVSYIRFRKHYDVAPDCAAWNAEELSFEETKTGGMPLPCTNAAAATCTVTSL